MSNRGGNGGFPHSGVQPNHTTQRNFGPSRPQTLNHQTRHMIPSNSANISQAVPSAGLPFHHQYVNQPNIIHQMPPQVQQRYPAPNQHQQHIPYQFISQIPTIFYPTVSHLHGNQFTLARAVQGAATNQAYNVGQGMVPSTENLPYYSDQYMPQAPTQDISSVTPAMQHLPPQVLPNKGTSAPKARVKAEIRDPNTGNLLTDDELRSPVVVKPETKPSKSSISNATSTTRENAASATDDRSQKTQEFMDGIAKAATAPFLKDKSNINDKDINKAAPETNRKGATLANDTYNQSVSKEANLVQTEKTLENVDKIKTTEPSSDSNIPKRKESTTEKDVPVKSTQESNALDNLEQKKSMKPAKSSESTDKATKSSGNETAAKASPEKKVKEQIDARIENDQLTTTTAVQPEPKQDSNNSATNGSTTLSFNKTVIESNSELRAAEPTQTPLANKDIPSLAETSPLVETKDTPTDETRQIVPTDVVDHSAVMARGDSLTPKEEFMKPNEVSEIPADAATSNEPLVENKENDRPTLDYPKVNSKGKYEYEAEFLRSLQSHPLSMKKPNLPDLDIVQQVPIPHREKQTNRMNDFLPAYMMTSRNNRSLPPRIGQRNSRELRPSKPPIKIIPSPSLNQDVSLHTVENAWKPAIPALKPVDSVDEEEKKTVELVKRFRGILNKLTPQKYDDLIKQVDALAIDSEDRLKRVLELIFDKAVDEPAFCTDYAKLCKHISASEKNKRSNEKKDGTSEKDETKVKEKQFRQALLSRCQKEFESDIYKDIDIEGRTKEIESITDPEKKRIAQLELDEDKRKARKRTLGIIKFIGELYMFDMLRVLIMDSCILQLLKSRDDESLECLCTLLRTVGAKWEHDNATSKKANPSQSMYCINVLQEIVQQRSTSSRVRFMIQDVLDMKQNGWKVRKIQADNKPKTIEQLHAEIQQEEQTKKHEIQQHIIKTGDTRKVPSKQDQWDNQTRNNRANTSNMMAVLETLKKTSATTAQSDNVSLQPQRGLWGSGASLGQGTSTSQNRSQNSDAIFGRNSLNEREKNSRTGGNNTGRDSMEGRVQSSGSSFRPFSSTEGEAHTSYPGRASTGSRFPSTMAPFSNTSEAVKKETTSRSNSMEKSRPSESRPSSSNNVARESPKKEAPPGVQFKGSPEENTEVISEKSNSLLKEYLQHGSKEDAKEDVLKICAETTVHIYVESVVTSSLEFSSQDQRLRVGEILAYLIKEEVIKQPQFNKGLNAILKISADLIIDIPKLWENLAATLVPIFCSSEDSNRKKFFARALELCKQEGAALIMYHILNFKKTEQFPYDSASAWITGGLEWSSFLPNKTKSPDEFLKEHNLTLPQFELQVKLDLMSYFVNKWQGVTVLYDNLMKQFTPEEVLEPKFLRALTQAVATKFIVPGTSNASHKLDKKFSTYCPLLAKFHKNQKPLELEIIFTIQELLGNYENPKGLLLEIFENLLKKASISGPTFIDWEADSLRFRNKGCAVLMVKEFLTRVKEGGSGSDS